MSGRARYCAGVIADGGRGYEMEYQPASGSSYILGAKAFPRIWRPNLRYAEASSPYPSPVVPVFGTSPRLEPRQQGSPDPADPRGVGARPPVHNPIGRRSIGYELQHRFQHRPGIK